MPGEAIGPARTASGAAHCFGKRRGIAPKGRSRYPSFLGDTTYRKYGDITSLPPEMQELLLTVSRTYDQYERDVQLVERSLDLSSGEMKDTYLKLEQKKQEPVDVRALF